LEIVPTGLSQLVRDHLETEGLATPAPLLVITVNFRTVQPVGEVARKLVRRGMATTTIGIDQAAEQGRGARWTVPLRDAAKGSGRRLGA